MSKKTLVAYFSATGVTAKAARLAAEAAGADLFEIRPSRPYTKADLNWNDSSSRSSMEMRDPASRPAIESKIENIGQYDTVLVGFPIWWYVAPTIINTFLESYDFSGKTVIPFATSGGSGLGGTVGRLKGSCADTVNWKPGRVLNGMSAAGIAQWVKGLGL
jgi:flavodoxin